MAITLIAWTYVTCICYGWGKLLLQLTEKTTQTHGKNSIPFSIVCFTGLAAVGCLAGVASLFVPLGLWQLQIPLALPCIGVLWKTFDRHSLRTILPFRSLHPTILFILLCTFVLMLVMSTWTITHPDSIDYHLQIIQWIEQYKPIPGLSHINMRLGLQNLWFPLCALFSFSFTHMGSPIFLNAVVVLWFIYFVLTQINNCMSIGNHIHAMLWIVLLAFSFCSYNQTRLTATSVSPDFIAALYLWLIFYITQNTNSFQHSTKYVLLSVLTGFAICIKLHALPVVVITAYVLWKLVTLRNFRAIFFSGVIGCLLLCSLITRNIITTGYPLFPSTFPNLAGIDWKLKKTEVTDVQKYITAYARTGSDGSREAVQKTLTLKPFDWLPIWWFNRSFADKIIILVLIGSMLILVASFKKIVNSNEEMKVSFLTSFAGIVFWFIQAPDPRFGFGFIVSFIALTCILLLDKTTAIPAVSNVRRMVMPSLIVGCIFLTFYTGYRFTKYFSAKQLIQPVGIMQIRYHQLPFSGILLNIPDHGPGCGNVPVPCCDKGAAKNFMLRGQTINEGFKSYEEK